MPCICTWLRAMFVLVFSASIGHAVLFCPFFHLLFALLWGGRESFPCIEGVLHVMQVNAAGDLCAICQEKMHAPILLRCKHIFCEDCVSEWSEQHFLC